MGDFDIKLLRFESCRFANNYLLSLQSYAFTSVIDKLIRVLSGSATLIDNIFIHHFIGQGSGDNIVSDISDHFPQFCLLPPGDVKVTKMSSVLNITIFQDFHRICLLTI